MGPLVPPFSSLLQLSQGLGPTTHSTTSHDLPEPNRAPRPLLQPSRCRLASTLPPPHHRADYVLHTGLSFLTLLLHLSLYYFSTWPEFLTHHCDSDPSWGGEAPLGLLNSELRPECEAAAVGPNLNRNAPGRLVSRYKGLEVGISLVGPRNINTLDGGK